MYWSWNLEKGIYLSTECEMKMKTEKEGIGDTKWSCIKSIKLWGNAFGKRWQGQVRVV